MLFIGDTAFDENLTQHERASPKERICQVHLSVQCLWMAVLINSRFQKMEYHR